MARDYLSASDLAWSAAKNPYHGLRALRQVGVCAVCAAPMQTNVAISDIETPTTSDHANIFRHSRDGVCEACAWLFMAGRGRLGNDVATPEAIEYTVISLESVVTDKRPWLHVLRDLAALPADTPVCGVMTTDVKPRLFHRTRLATIGAFGLYVHALDYDRSEYVAFDLRECLAIIDAMTPALQRGYAKRSLYFGLLTDHARSSADLGFCMDAEQRLTAARANPAFLPALIAAGVTKEDKHDVKRSRIDGEPASTPARRDPAPQGQLGLF